MSSKKEIFLHDYLSLLTAKKKKEIAGIIRKETGINYIYQTISGTNTPPIGLLTDQFIAFSEKNKIDGCYVSEESILAGYVAIRDGKK